MEPRSGGSNDRGRGRRRWLAAGLSVLIVGLGIFALLQAGSSDSGGPLNAIAAAAVRTQEQPGGRAVMHAIVTSPAAGTSTMRGRMLFNHEGHARAVIRMSRSDSPGDMKLEMVSDGTFLYMRSSKFGRLPEGREWMGIDLSLGMESQPPLPAGSDAKGQLAFLEAATGGVKKLGTQTVRGVPTTHYQGTISPARYGEQLRDEGKGKLASGLEEKGAPMRVEAWIDAKGLIRRMRAVQRQQVGGSKETQTLHMRFDYFDFGIDPTIEVPDSGEVFDATESIRDGLETPSE